MISLRIILLDTFIIRVLSGAKLASIRNLIILSASFGMSFGRVRSLYLSLAAILMSSKLPSRQQLCKLAAINKYPRCVAVRPFGVLIDCYEIVDLDYFDVLEPIPRREHILLREFFYLV